MSISNVVSGMTPATMVVVLLVAGPLIPDTNTQSVVTLVPHAQVQGVKQFVCPSVIVGTKSPDLVVSMTRQSMW